MNVRKNPTALIFNIPCRVNCDKLIAAGLKLNVRTLTDELRLMERQRGQAPNVDAFRFNKGLGRVDAAGTVRSDTGTPLLGSWEGSQHEAISLSQTVADVVAAGYTLVNVNLTEREGKQPSLFLRFEENPSSDRICGLWESLSNEIVFLLNRSYRKVQIWDNASTKGDMTINPSAALQEAEVAKLTDPRLLRMTPEFSFRNVKVDAKQPTVKRAPDAFDHTPAAVEQPRKPRRPYMV